MLRLNVWDGAALVGAFTRTESRKVAFSYEPGYEGAPISCSMPVGGNWAEDTPLNFLEGLLPEGPARWSCPVTDGFRPGDAFGMLDASDVVGGLVYSTADEPPCTAPLEAVRAGEKSIGARLRELASRDGLDAEENTPARFSLAGTQGKLTLSRIGEMWYWPNASIPSTHIMKPESRRAPVSHRVEDATMTLASLVGLEVPAHGICGFDGVETYWVCRFDRSGPKGGLSRRLSVEDLSQALGLPPRRTSTAFGRARSWRSCEGSTLQTHSHINGWASSCSIRARRTPTPTRRTTA